MIQKPVSHITAIALLALGFLLTACAPRMGPQAPSVQLPEQPKQVALLLPLHGRYAASGQAIRNGFLAAYYQAKQANPSAAPIVRIVDTSRGDDVGTLYRKAVSDGAQVVVGPLTKQNVSRLDRLSGLSIPTLALNTTADPSPPGQLYQFSLSPETEADQAAQKAWNDGLRRTLLLAPTTPAGQRIAQSFAARWRVLGGTIVDTLNYTQDKQLALKIRDLVGVNSSYARTTRIEQIFGKRIRSVPRRRQDVDMIFLVASPAQASQVVPLLKFYYAGDIPIYATSMIYSGFPNTNADRDIDGVRFSDMPYVLGDAGTLSPELQQVRQRITTLWPRAFRRNTRLFAMGVDAYGLINNLNRLIQSPQNGISGATGTLSLSADRHIVRQLTWIRMRNGQPYYDG